jgi:hypothetical protein
MISLTMINGRCAQTPVIHGRLGELVESTLSCPSRSALCKGGVREKAVFDRRRSSRTGGPLARFVISEIPCAKL